MNGYSTLLHYIAPGKYIVIKNAYGLQLHFKTLLNKSDKKQQQKSLNACDFGLKNTFTVICKQVLMI